MTWPGPDDTGVREVSTGDDHHYKVMDAAYVLEYCSWPTAAQFEAHLPRMPGPSSCGCPPQAVPARSRRVAAISESAPDPVASSVAVELLPPLLAAVHRRVGAVPGQTCLSAAAVLAIGASRCTRGTVRAAVSALTRSCYVHGVDSV